MSQKKLGLDDAYAVETPEDNRALYRDWATTYESDFAEALGYIYHDEVAAVFAAHRIWHQISCDVAILDVGCGTGIVGTALQSRGYSVIDGIDISPEMLAQAAQKGAYRSLVEVDVTQPIAIDDGSYAGVVSAGTFTHGHLGPEPIRELVRLGAPGALFAIGINAEHYRASGFDKLFDELQATEAITALELADIPMYDGGDGDHANDRALVALFQRTP